MEVDERLPLLPLLLAEVPNGFSTLLTEEGIPWRMHHREVALARFVLYDRKYSREPTVLPGQTPIDISSLRTEFSRDPYQQLHQVHSAPHQFRVSQLRLTEEVASVNRRSLRKQLLAHLRLLLEQAGGVWMRFSDYPFPYRSAFCLRLDHDEYQAEDLRRLLKAIQGHEACVSHYLCGSAYEDYPDELAKFRNYHVGSHGYWHHTYRSYQENLTNLRRGIEVLTKAGLHPLGFVAPHGKFSAELLEALETCGVSHSSEFALAYDDTPFFPLNSPVLQMPVHPVCFGLFQQALKVTTKENSRHNLAVDLAIGYYQTLIRDKYRRGEPIFLYGHPDHRLGRYPQLVAAMFEAIQSFAALWKVNLAEFERWWRFRQQCTFQVHKHGQQWVVITDKPHEGFELGIEFWRGHRMALLPADDPLMRFRRDAIAFEKRSAEPSPGSSPVRPPKSLRSFIKKQIDWERTTPRDAIQRDSWRGWTKWLLRSFVDE